MKDNDIRCTSLTIFCDFITHRYRQRLKTTLEIAKLSDQWLVAYNMESYATLCVYSSSFRVMFWRRSRQNTLSGCIYTSKSNISSQNKLVRRVCFWMYYVFCAEKKILRRKKFCADFCLLKHCWRRLLCHFSLSVCIHFYYPTTICFLFLSKEYLLDHHQISRVQNDSIGCF